MVRLGAGGLGRAGAAARCWEAQPAALCFLLQLFFTQLQVGLIQQVHGAGQGGLGRGDLTWVLGEQELMLCPPLQWMVPTIQNSMKPFKVRGQASLWLEGWGWPRMPAEPCPHRIWTTRASSSVS